MDREHYNELVENLQVCETENILSGKKIYLFGHCDATVTLADLLLEKDFKIFGILDNNSEKYGMDYSGIPVLPPTAILSETPNESVVLIVTRFYEAMNAQLRRLGYRGEIRKLVDYNTYAEYSLSTETITRKLKRVVYGGQIIRDLEVKYPSAFRVFCPFAALGDIYFCMSYLPYFQKERGFDDYVVCVLSAACGKVAALFGAMHVEVMEQKEMDAAIQATIYRQDKNGFVAHQDRPYVVQLHNALYLRKIPLEKVYCCGIFGLHEDVQPVEPTGWREYSKAAEIDAGRAVVLSPYAKSVTPLSEKIWIDIVADFTGRGYQVFTNVSGEERPLPCTTAICADIAEMKSVVEQAGIFIGIRSGLCDVIRTAHCRKIALYPEYNYSDTKWKAIDMYAIDGFENIAVGDNFAWQSI